MANGEIAGIGNETFLCRFAVQFHCPRNARSISNGNDGKKDYLPEITAAICCLGHGSDGFIPVVCNDDVIGCAKMQVPQHMTGREGGNEELFGVVPAG